MQILLIRLRLIGDVVFTTPAVRALRRRFPDARLTYLVEDAAAPVVLGNPHLDEALVIPRTRGARRAIDDLRVGLQLRRRRFDLAIDFHGGPRGSWLAWLSGARRRIGYAVPGRAWMYTDAVDRPRDLRPRHSVLNQWDLLRPLGLGDPDPGSDATEMPESPPAAARVDRRLAEAGVAPGDAIVVLHVSAGNPFRRWPLDAFAALAASLARRASARRIVLTSGPSEADAAATVADRARAALGPHAGRIVTGGEFSLTELRSLVGRAALFVGGDSGPMHIAGTTTTPVVGLYGPTLPVRSAPWRDPRLVHEAVETPDLPCRPCDQRTCVPGDFRCLAWITPETVAAAAARALARAAAPRLEPSLRGADA